MDKREIRIVKAADTEKLIVLHARSHEDKIKFYINENECFVGEKIKDKNEIIVNLCDDTKNKEIVPEISLKDNLKFALSSYHIILPSALIVFLSIISIIFIASLINNTLISLLLITTIPFITKITTVTLFEFKETSMSLKSKHAAEHMMINCLETYRRLPKSLKELKNSSRFRKDCSSRKKIKGFTNNYLSLSVAGLITYFAEYFLSFLSLNAIIYLIILVSLYFLIYFLTNIALTKIKKLQFIVMPLENLLNNIVQCANTTQKVDQVDFLLAYCVAKEWIKLVYPNFYDESGDTFLDNFFEEK